MSDRTRERTGTGDAPSDLSRRDFMAVSVAAGIAATSRPASAEAQIVAADVEIPTPDGRCDAAFFHPASGRHPGVLIWPDAFGLRPVLREMGRRLAGSGYAVLVPNPFYRKARAPVLDMAHFDFQNPSDREKLAPLMASVQAPGAAERDAVAYVAFLDAQRAVDTRRKIGTQGYCMGGALALRSAASVPGRIGAAATFHAGGLVTDKADSPHLLAPKIRARIYVAVAANDDEKQPEAKDVLRAAFAAAKLTAEVELYPKALHGWCMRDMPVRAGQPPIYDEADAEKAWAKLLALYAAALA